MAKRSRLDGTHASIRNTLSSLGCSVATTTSVGYGFPDLVVGILGQTHLVEAKPEKGQLRDSQKNFQAGWRGATVWILRSPEDALGMVTQIRKEVLADAVKKVTKSKEVG